MGRHLFVLGIVIMAILMGRFREGPSLPTSLAATAESTAATSSDAGPVYYRNCSAAWAAHAAPIFDGEPGYRPELDGDHDGIACEPFYGRR